MGVAKNTLSEGGEEASQTTITRKLHGAKKEVLENRDSPRRTSD